MNSRQKKKNISKYINNISNVVLKKDELLLFEFDTERITLESMSEYMKYVNSRTQNRAIAVPMGMINVKKIKEEDIATTRT